MMNLPLTILIIEDEIAIIRFLRASLANEGYIIDDATSGEQGLIKASSQPPDLIILDLGLPDLDGTIVLQRLREWYSGPIIILSARDQEAQKIEALDSGADDYLTKPFGLGELLARMRTALRHSHGRKQDESSLCIGELKLDLVARTIHLGNELLHLTPLEYKLLSMLMKNAGKVLTHRQVLKEVWGPHSTYETHYVRVFVANLRKKIEVDPARPRYLFTEPGVGYRFTSD